MLLLVQWGLLPESQDVARTVEVPATSGGRQVRGEMKGDSGIVIEDVCEDNM